MCYTASEGVPSLLSNNLFSFDTILLLLSFTRTTTRVVIHLPAIIELPTLHLPLPPPTNLEEIKDGSWGNQILKATKGRLQIDGFLADVSRESFGRFRSRSKTIFCFGLVGWISSASHGYFLFLWTQRVLFQRLPDQLKASLGVIKSRAADRWRHVKWTLLPSGNTVRDFCASLYINVSVSVRLYAVHNVLKRKCNRFDKTTMYMCVKTHLLQNCHGP
jgi:hypothetical protein